MLRALRFALFTSIILEARAFKFEGKPANGIYNIIQDENGKQIPKWLGPLGTTETKEVEAPSPPPSKDITSGDRDPFYETTCSWNILPAIDARASYNYLKKYCGNWQWVDGHIVVVSGDVIAYACRYQGVSICHANETLHANAVINTVCGEGISGRWVSIGKPAMMYGFDISTWNVCCDGVTVPC